MQKGSIPKPEHRPPDPGPGHLAAHSRQTTLVRSSAADQAQLVAPPRQQHGDRYRYAEFWGGRSTGNNRAARPSAEPAQVCSGRTRSTLHPNAFRTSDAAIRRAVLSLGYGLPWRHKSVRAAAWIYLLCSMPSPSAILWLTSQQIYSR